MLSVLLTAPALCPKPRGLQIGRLFEGRNGFNRPSSVSVVWQALLGPTADETWLLTDIPRSFILDRFIQQCSFMNTEYRPSSAGQNLS